MNGVILLAQNKGLLGWVKAHGVSLALTPRAKKFFVTNVFLENSYVVTKEVKRQSNFVLWFSGSCFLEGVYLTF